MRLVSGLGRSVTTKLVRKGLGKPALGWAAYAAKPTGSSAVTLGGSALTLGLGAHALEAYWLCATRPLLVAKCDSAVENPGLFDLSPHRRQDAPRAAG